MAFAFRQDESIPKGVRRVVRKQLENAAAKLNDSARESVDERIHSVRKSLKRVRAVVRLVRFSMADSAYRHENDSFRDAARPLSEVRDAKVLIEALDKLEKLSRREDKAAIFRPARRTLEKRQSEVRERILEEKNTFSNTANAIENANKRLRKWSDLSADWQEIAKGIKQVYRSGRNALDEVKANLRLKIRWNHAEPPADALALFRFRIEFLEYRLADSQKRVEAIEGYVRQQSQWYAMGAGPLPEDAAYDELQKKRSEVEVFNKQLTKARQELRRLTGPSQRECFEAQATGRQRAAEAAMARAFTS